jgi:CheY-like chemotaxis protein
VEQLVLVAQCFGFSPLTVRFGDELSVSLTKGCQPSLRREASCFGIGNQMSFIIVADDDPVFLGLLTITLENAGHVVGAVGDGQSAVAAIERKQPDLAILDINMPGCSGVDAVRQLRLRGYAREVPIIMLTGRASHKGFGHCLPGRCR